MSNPRKRGRWDVAPEPVRMRLYGPRLPGGQFYSKSDQARADNRNARLYGRGRWSAGGGGELKFFDTAIAFAFDNTAEVPATGQLVLIPQGVTEATRIGRKCVIKSLQMRMNWVFQPGASATASTTVAMYVVQDTQTNGAAAAITDVVTSTNLTVALIEPQETSRFRILKKIIYSFNPPAGATTAYNQTVKHVEFYRKLNIPLEFSSTAGALTELRTNNIFLLAGSDGGADDLVSVSGNARVRFSDA